MRPVKRIHWTPNTRPPPFLSLRMAMSYDQHAMRRNPTTLKTDHMQAFLPTVSLQIDSTSYTCNTQYQQVYIDYSCIRRATSLHKTIPYFFTTKKRLRECVLTFHTSLALSPTSLSQKCFSTHFLHTVLTSTVLDRENHRSLPRLEDPPLLH